MPLGKVFALSIYFSLIIFDKWKVTRLKGKYPLTILFSASNKNLEQSNDFEELEDSIEQQDNSLSNQILLPRKKPGVYMIHCLTNDRRYYGETKNVSARLASHRSLLRKNIQGNRELQSDWNTYSEANSQFIPLFLGKNWIDRKVRLEKELFLVLQNPDLCYNHIEWYDRSGEKNPFYGGRHTDESKTLISIANSKPNEALGNGICLNGINYASIAEASRKTGMARKTIRKRLQDPNDFSCKLIKLPEHLKKTMSCKFGKRFNDHP
jgi:hypothetical protein